MIEAAAHGVPTVATKNGGPVDIMATLHHGVVVDPTDSDAVAAALLKILTNPQVWDSMSGNGTKNIMVRRCAAGRWVGAACGLRLPLSGARAWGQRPGLHLTC